MINFFCACGQPMAVKPEFIGRTGTCPRCKQPVTVPPQSVTAPAPTRPPAPPQPLPQPPVRTAPAPPRPPVASAPAMTQPFDRRPLVAPPPPPPSTSVGPAARLEVVHGPPNVLGKVFTVQAGRRSVVGRDAACEVPIASDRVSRRHCQLEPGPGGYVLEDLGSSNGTLVNQERVQGKRLLRGGEYIQAGDCLLRFTL
ncbi:MAG: FHA domain-containing protein [Planctomycetes bacterium]|nr:FHA domain-containing protein [Planctomycetota bacterium]